VSHKPLYCCLPLCHTNHFTAVSHCVTQTTLLLSPIVSHKTLYCFLPLCHTKCFAVVSHCVTQNALLLSPIVSHKTLCCCLPLCHAHKILCCSLPSYHTKQCSAISTSSTQLFLNLWYRTALVRESMSMAATLKKSYYIKQ